MMQDNFPNINDRKPLFPGSSCFPLSPDNNNKSSSPYTSSDQLNIIFDVIGTPHEDQLSFLTDLKAQSYVKSFHPRPPLDLKARYPAARDEALDLLSSLLNFNPFFRPTVQDCLDHPYLKCVKSAQLEQMAEKEINLEIDKVTFS